MQASELNAAAAKLMGWAHFCADLVPDDEGLFRTDSGDVVSILHDYTPASNLTQAWEFARAKAEDGWIVENDCVAVFGEDPVSEPHDGTTQDAARALTTCVLRANGVEVPPLAAERTTNDSE